MALLFSVVLLDLIGFGIVIPILPFLSPQLGASQLDIAYIIVVYAVCSGLCGPFWGRLSDRMGRKPVIMICLAGASLSYVMLGLASELWMIYAARAFAGLMAGNFGVASAMMADITRPENRARGMGVIGAAWGMGLVIGPLMGGLLAGENASFTLPCIVAGGMSVLAIIAAAVFLPESLSAEKRAAHRAQQQDAGRNSSYQLLKSTGNRLFVSQYALHNSGVSAVTYMLPLWFGDLLAWTARDVGILFGVQGAIMALLQGGLLGVLVRLFGEWILLRLCILIFLAGTLTAVLADQQTLMITATFMSITGATMCMPLLNSLITERTPAPSRGQMMGLTSSASSAGRVLGPLMAGSILVSFGYSWAWSACAVIVFLYFLLVMYEARRSQTN
jgi:DHA1 family tetracycline resistance protein-like MFS transporter